MFGKLACSSGALLLLLCFLGHGYTANASDSSYIYFDNTQYLANASNVVQMSWPTLGAAFARPNLSDSAGFSGLDWTKPFPGSAISGFTTHLRIADDVPFPPAVTTENVVTNVAAISFGIPPSMKTNGLPKTMDSSWYICQHFYVSTLPDPTKDIAHDCSFLPTQCQMDLKTDLAQDWGAVESETGAMCGGYALDTITASCQSTLGTVTADVLGWNASYLADIDTAKSLTVDEVGQYSWMIGTGFNDPNNQTSYYAASNRTYIVATVFGYSLGYANSSQPVVELACVRPKWPGTAPATPTQATSSSTSTPSVSSATTSSSATSGTSSKTTSSATGPGTHFPLACLLLFVSVLLCI